MPSDPTYVSFAKSHNDNYHLAEYFAQRIVDDELAGRSKLEAWLSRAWEYRDILNAAYDVSTTDDYPEGFKEAAIFIIIASAMGRFINLDGAIASLNEAADIVKSYEDQLKDLAEKYPNLLTYDENTETLTFPWNPENTLIHELDPPESHVELTGVAPAAGDYPSPVDDRPLRPDLGSVLVPFEQSKSTATPLVLDLTGSGINLTELGEEGTVYWNITSGDFANASAWIGAGTGLLAIDLNENGIIDDHSELFGTLTTDGFTVLSAYDTNTDDAITSADADWSDLLVWVDANGDGYSQSAELHTLDSLLITSIDLDADLVSYDIAGNPVTHESTFTMDGQTRTMVDAWFAYDTVNTIYVADYTLDARVLYLPMLRGYGNLPDLHIAMSLDEDLLDMVEDLAAAGVTQILDPASHSVRDIMFRWAGVDDIDPTSRGSYTDARVLGFLETMMGQDWVDDWASSNPALQQSAVLQTAWQAAFSAYEAQLFIQLGGGEIFSDAATFGPIAGSISTPTGLDIPTLDALASEFDHSNAADSAMFWMKIIDVIENVIGIANLDQNDIDDLDDIIVSLDLHELLDLEVLMDAIEDRGTVFAGDSGDNFLVADYVGRTLNGYAGQDILIGGWAGDTLYGGDGDDSLSAGEGNDALYGNAGNDTFIGGAGNDALRGSTGDDSYLFADGWGTDTITEYVSEGTDTIEFTDLASADVRMYTNHVGTLFIVNKADANDLITVYANHTGSASLIGQYLESVVFTDVTVNLTAGLTLEGSSNSESVYGTTFDDTIYGMGAGDTLYGYAGNDTLIGGAGNDALRGSTGDDTYIFAEGWGADTITEYVSEGTDTIEFTDLASADVRMYTNHVGTLFIVNKADASDLITINANHTGGASLIGQYLESVVFTDTTVSLTAGLTLEGSSNSESIYGTTFDDTIYGMGAGDSLYGYAGNDTLIGGAGNDALRGSTGDDTYIFAEGWDTDTITEYVSEGIDTIEFTDLASADVRMYTNNVGALFIVNKADASDLITINASHTGGASLVGQYVESIVFTNTTVDLTAGLTLEGSNNSESLYGTTFDDTIYGMGAGDSLYGYAGNDQLIGGEGNDALHGHDGNDTLIGGAGNDTLYGNAGDDLTIFEAGLDSIYESTGNDTLHISGGVTINDVSISNLSTYHAKLVVNASTDEITLSNLRHTNTDYHIENLSFDDGFITDQLPSYQSWLWGTSGNDSATGNGNDNVMVGRAGNDTMEGFGGHDDIHGGTGNDTIYGGDGDDLLHGGEGDDILYGGDGHDVLFGGAGQDAFIFESTSAFNDVDIIKDFGVSDDVIDLVSVMSATAFDPQQDAITDWIEMTTDGDDTILKVDRDGTGGSYGFDQVATIEGVTGLTDEQTLVTSGTLLLAA